MLDNLKSSLRSAIKKIVNSSGVDEELIKELSKDVQRSLLQSDVNVKLVSVSYTHLTLPTNREV